MMLINKWLTSKVFIKQNHIDGGLWEVMLGNSNRAFLPKHCYGCVLETFVTKDAAREASMAYQEILAWRSVKLSTLVASFKIRAKLARSFTLRDLKDKWSTTKIVVHKGRPATLIGPIYTLQVASEYISPRQWITIPTELILSRQYATWLAGEYTEVLKARNITAAKPRPTEVW